MILTNNNYDQIKILIKGLSKYEISDLIRELSSEEIKSSIFSLYKSIENSKEKICPYCKSKMIKKIGKVNGNQRYLCHLCHKSYFSTICSVFHKTHKDKDTWIKFIELMLSGVSLRKSKTICKINYKTAFKWRHKIMDVLVEVLKSNKLTDKVELDDTFFKQSFKGEKGKSNKLLTNLRGISHNLICYTTATSSNGAVVSAFNGYGKNTIEKMNNIFTNKINPCSIVYSDDELAYREFARTNNLKLIQINSKVVKEQNKLRHVNSLHSMLKAMIRRTHGVHSKYLDKYVQWVSWCKQSAKLSFAQQINAMFKDCCKTSLENI